jgi:hypothetical protein
MHEKETHFTEKVHAHAHAGVLRTLRTLCTTHAPPPPRAHMHAQHGHRVHAPVPLREHDRSVAVLRDDAAAPA